jgi:RNA-directed DNA polymerase
VTRALTATGESMANANHSCDKVRALHRALYVAAKANPQRRFHALYDRMADRHTPRVAWRQVRRNRGAAGIDGETLDAVGAYGLDRLLSELRGRLLNKTYRSQQRWP